MNVKKLQGRVPTLRDQQKAFMRRTSAYKSVDFDALRTEFKSREFVVPVAPISVRSDLLKESDRYWRLVDEFKRYGSVEQNVSSAPYLGEVFYENC